MCTSVRESVSEREKCERGKKKNDFVCECERMWVRLCISGRICKRITLHEKIEGLM